MNLKGKFPQWWKSQKGKSYSSLTEVAEAFGSHVVDTVLAKIDIPDDVLEKIEKDIGKG